MRKTTIYRLKLKRQTLYLPFFFVFLWLIYKEKESKFVCFDKTQYFVFLGIDLHNKM